MAEFGSWNERSSGRKVIDLRLPQGDCDAEALRRVIDCWVAPTLAVLYVEQHLMAGKGVAGTFRPDGSEMPNV